MIDLQDGVAIVTGAASGIGEAAAMRFAEAGVNVLAADVDGEGGVATVEDITESGGEATFVETDVSDPEDVEAMVEAAVGTYGDLDYAFNNAGIGGAPSALTEQPLDNWEQVIDVNLKGVFLCMQAEIPHMRQTGGGAIVNTSSIAGVVGMPGVSPYVACKHGIAGLTKSAAIEYSEAGVRVNAVCPGLIETPMIDRGGSEFKERSIAATPMGRAGQPPEIGDAAVWLCSDDASFVTGETLVIDGGLTSQ